MYKQLLTLILFFFSLNTTQSQTSNFRVQDSLNLHFYEKGDWNAVLKSGNELLESGNDYYYLRLRMGIAAYQKQQFLLARKHLNQAISFNENDQLALSYLYGTYLETNQLYTGVKAISKRTEIIPADFGIKKGLKIKSIHADYGQQQYTHSPALNFATLASSQALFGESREYQNHQFYDAGIRLQLNSSGELYLGLQSLDINVSDQFAYVENSIARDSVAMFDWGEAYYYRSDSSRKRAEFDNQIKQFSFYARLEQAISEKVTLIGAFHLLQLDQTQTLAENQVFTFSDTAYYLYNGTETELFESTGSRYQFTDISFKSTEWSGFLGIDLQTAIGVSSFGVSLSRFNKSQYFQANAGLRYYPLGNLKLYGSTTFYLVNGSEDPHLIATQQIGFQPIKNIWVETSFSQGNHSYLSKDNGYLVFNTTYQTKTRIEATLFAKIAKNGLLRFGYVYQKGAHPFQNYNTENGNMTESYHDFQTHSIVGGIQWTF
ncbi:MAG: hypothetical protein M0Q90_10630 [Bacteroidales bacterium]|nr:hypothetical protein [Bacteroidales bacterium]